MLISGGHATFALIALVIARRWVRSDVCRCSGPLPPAFLSGTAAAGGFALINSIGNLGGIVSPYLVGVAVDVTGKPAAGLYAIAGVMILAALLILFGLPERIAKRDTSL